MTILPLFFVANSFKTQVFPSLVFLSLSGCSYANALRDEIFYNRLNRTANYSWINSSVWSQFLSFETTGSCFSVNCTHAEQWQILFFLHCYSWPSYPIFPFLNSSSRLLILVVFSDLSWVLIYYSRNRHLFLLHVNVVFGSAIFQCIVDDIFRILRYVCLIIGLFIYYILGQCSLIVQCFMKFKYKCFCPELLSISDGLECLLRFKTE